MIYNKIELIKLYSELAKSNVNPILTEFIHENSDEVAIKKYPAVIICPGGGYWRISDREADVVAHQFFAKGFNAFVLRYTVSPFCVFPQALFELAASIDYVRKNAAIHKTKKNKIAVCGFSAGGHLAASLGVFWNRLCEFKTNLSFLNVDLSNFRPDAMILGYPVITAGKFTHQESVRSLLGRDASLAEIELLSLEKHVTEKTPPTFIWSTATDGLVPIQNTLYFATALADNFISHEVHIFSEGSHGLSLANKESALLGIQTNPRIEKWLSMCFDWFETL